MFCRDMNLSKLIDEDEPLFLSLTEDMFPGIKLTTKSWKDLQKAITVVCKEMGMVNHPSWNLKIIQLYETSLVRHGLMVMGKSTIAFNFLETTHLITLLNTVFFTLYHHFCFCRCTFIIKNIICCFHQVQFFVTAHFYLIDMMLFE